MRQMRLRAIDLVIIALNLFFALVHLIFAGVRAGGPIAFVFLASNGVVFSFALADGRGLLRRRTPLHFLRVFYAQAFYLLYFMSVIPLSQQIWGDASFDAVFHQAEEALFGTQLAVVLPERFGHLRPLNELFYFAYFSFYPLVCALGWVLYLKRRYEDADQALFLLTASYAVLFVWYAFYPVHGPKYFIPELHARWYSDLDGYLFAGIMRAIFSDANLAGAAVPSSHVAISSLAVVLYARYLPRTIPWLAPLLLLIWISTVYLYAHYAVDVLLGLAVMPLLLWIAGRLHRRLEGRVDADHSAPEEDAVDAGPDWAG